MNAPRVNAHSFGLTTSRCASFELRSSNIRFFCDWLRLFAAVAPGSTHIK